MFFNIFFFSFFFAVYVWFGSYPWGVQDWWRFWATLSSRQQVACHEKREKKSLKSYAWKWKIDLLNFRRQITLLHSGFFITSPLCFEFFLGLLYVIVSFITYDLCVDEGKRAGESQRWVGKIGKGFSEKLKEAKASSNEERKHGDALDVKLSNLHQFQKDALAESESLKAKVQKVVKDITSVLGEGYNRCLERGSETGSNTARHSFDDYIWDYAFSQPMKNHTQPTLSSIEGEGCLVNLFNSTFF